MVDAISSAATTILSSSSSSSSTSSSSNTDVAALEAQLAAKQSELAKTEDEDDKKELEEQIATLQKQIADAKAAEAKKLADTGSSNQKPEQVPAQMSGESDRIGSKNFDENTEFGERTAYV
ncbi:FlxA-like family protein [Rhizobium sp. FKY42]|uniref:FlxA-like family protein n=1 Tax=Rhizobium sp. FKY42 TaxID=2562310 RepID=UPI0010C13A4A|nr:FlxA-like family protein [Rhizobium sp. FKY42]